LWPARGGSAERLAELEVEPALLSVICRELNERRRTLGQPQISADLVSGNRREILTDFYERSVADLPEAMRAFVEDHLLTKSGFRDNLALETALEFPGVTRPLIDTLVSRRLVRLEDRLGVQRVELTHDVLAEVIRAARDERRQRRAGEELVQRERAAKEAAEAELAKTRAHQDTTRRALWRARIVALGCAALAVAAIGSAVFGYLNLRRARAAGAQAMVAEAKALTSAEAARRAEERAMQVRKMAEAARVEAEKLVSFLLDDFYDELAPTGRLSTVGRLAKQAADYYAALPAELRSQATERGRAIALARYGATLVYQSGTNEEGQAKPVLEQAAALLEKLRDEGDDSEGTLIGLAIAKKSLADALSSLNDPTGAFATMKELVGKFRPVMAKAGTSRRLRQVFGETLSLFGYLQDRVYTSTENATATFAEARQIFVELGAKPMTDLNAASAYAEAALRARLPKGNLPVSERGALIRDARATADAVLAKRPGDLRALRTRAEAMNLSLYSQAALLERNAESEAAARVEVLKEAESAWAEYLRYDSSNAEGWGNLGTIRQTLANTLLGHGRVKAAEEKIQSALAIEQELTLTPTLAGFVQGWWSTAAKIAALQGDHARAAECLKNLQRVVDVRIREFRADSTSRVGPQELVHTAERLVQRQLGDFEAMYRDAQHALVRGEAYKPASDLGKSGKLLRANEARRDLADAALQMGRFKEAEEAMRTLTDEGGRGARSRVNAGDRVLLAFALFRQDRIEEARATLAGVKKPATRPAAIDNDLNLRFDYLFSLYAQAVIQPADAAGSTRRRELLSEAVALGDAQTDEVKATQSYKRIRAQIDDAAAAR